MTDGYEKNRLLKKGLERRSFDLDEEHMNMITDIALYKGWHIKATGEWILKWGIRKIHRKAMAKWRKDKGLVE